MKRSIISVLAAFALTAAYYVLALIAGPIVSGGPPMAIPAGLYAPISLPSRVFLAIVPESIQMATMSTPGVEPVLFFAGNVLLLAVLIFAIVSLISKKGN